MIVFTIIGLIVCAIIALLIGCAIFVRLTDKHRGQWPNP